MTELLQKGKLMCSLAEATMSDLLALQPSAELKTPTHKLKALSLLTPDQRLARAVLMLFSGYTRWTADDYARWQALTGATEVAPPVLINLAKVVERTAAHVDLEPE